MEKFEFDMGQKVKLNASDETGIVIGQAHHLDSNDQFSIRYKAGDGRQTECWWPASAISAV